MSVFKSCLLVLLFSALFLGIVNIIHAAKPYTVRVGTYDNKPKIYKDDDGNTKGVFADVINFVAEKENWNIEYVYGLWEEGLDRLEKGEIDLMVDVAFSDEREKVYDFTNEAVVNSWGEVYVHKDSNIDSILDLDGKKISILKSSTYESGKEGIENYLKAFGINATIMEVDENVDVLYLVESGVADAGIVSHIFGVTHQNNYVDLKVTQIFLKTSELKFALTKGDSDNTYLIGKLDFWVKKLKDGYEDYYSNSLKKNGLTEIESMTVSRQEKTSTLSCIQSAVLGAVAGFLLFGLVNILMKLIRKKTIWHIKDKNIVSTDMIKNGREFKKKFFHKNTDRK